MGGAAQDEDTVRPPGVRTAPRRCRGDAAIPVPRAPPSRLRYCTAAPATNPQSHSLTLRFCTHGDVSVRKADERGGEEIHPGCVSESEG